MRYVGDTVLVQRMVLIKLCIIILAGLPGVDLPFAGVWLAVPAGLALGFGLSGNGNGRVLWYERQLVSFVGSGFGWWFGLISVFWMVVRFDLRGSV